MKVEPMSVDEIRELLIDSYLDENSRRLILSWAHERARADEKQHILDQHEGDDSDCEIQSKEWLLDTLNEIGWPKDHR